MPLLKGYRSTLCFLIVFFLHLKIRLWESADHWDICKSQILGCPNAFPVLRNQNFVSN